MKAADLPFNPIDNYLRLLNSLSPDKKLELISRLSESLNEPKKSTSRTIGNLFGAFISKKSADEIISELKNSRNFKRKTGFEKVSP
jgi:hypothetical protein